MDKTNERKLKEVTKRTVAEKARRKSDKQLNDGLEARIRELDEAIKRKEETIRALKALLEKKYSKEARTRS